MIQQILNALSAHVDLTIFSGFIGVLVLVALFGWPKRPWMRFEARSIRPLAERREDFLKWAVVLVMIGLAAVVYHFRNPASHVGRFTFDIAALLMAAIGFFFAIYGIRGVMERPRNLDEVLIRATEFLGKYEEKNKYTAIMLCEYPAWGALSRQRTNEYVRFANALKKFLEAGTDRKLVLVAPKDEQMKRRIGQYATDYGRTEDEASKAKGLNETLVNALQALGNDAPDGFKRWQINQAPRYQMLLIGEQIKGDKGLRLLEAIVWFAPRCSDVLNEDSNATAVAVAAPQEGQRNEKRINIGEEVPILAWHTTARDALDELYDSAFFYAKFYADGTKPQDYKAFLAV